MRSRTTIGLAALALAVLPVGCGSGTTTADRRQALEDYVAKVQPIRLGNNELLDKADPILEGDRDGDLSAKQAQRGSGGIERASARSTIQIAAMQHDPKDTQACR